MGSGGSKGSTVAKVEDNPADELKDFQAPYVKNVNVVGDSDYDDEIDDFPKEMFKPQEGMPADQDENEEENQ